MRTDRRGLLMATPAIAVLAAVPAFAAESPDTAEWDAAMRVHLEAKKASDAFMPGYQALMAKYDRLIDRLPHVVVGYRGPIEIATYDDWQVRRSRRMITDVAEGRCRLDPIPDVQEGFRLDKLLVEAADERQAQVDAIRDRLQLKAAEDKAEALGEREHETLWDLMDMPAPNGRALLFKLEYLLASDDAQSGSWSENALQPTLADMRRLLAEA